MRYLFLPALCVFMMGATPADSGLQALQHEDQRIATIAYRLQAANADLCNDKMPLPGFSVHDLGQYVPSYRDQAAAAFGLKPGVPAVLAVVPGSPAAKAGLKADEPLRAVNGKPVTTVLPKTASDEPTAAVEAAMVEAMRKGPVALDAGQQARILRFTAEWGCSSRVQLVPGRKLNASADGTSVQLSTGLVAFAGNDDGIAAALAHELAHNILGHRKAIRAKRMKTRDTEIEADLWSMYLMVRAGFDGDRGIDFWKRYEDRTNLGFLSDGTHPSKKKRLDTVTGALAHIRKLQAVGQPVRPPESQSAPPALKQNSSHAQFWR